MAKPLHHNMPAESIVYRDWVDGMTPKEMAERYDAKPDTIRSYLATHIDRWQCSPPPQLCADHRKIVVQRTVWADGAVRRVLQSLPRNSMHVAAMESAAHG